MIKRSMIDLAVSDIRKLTVGDIVDGKFNSPSDAFNAYYDRLCSLRSKYAAVLDEVIEEFAEFDQPITVGEYLEGREEDDEEEIWEIWRFLTPMCLRD